MWETGLILVKASQPRRQGVGRDERVRQERQREHHHQGVALHGLGAPADGAEPGEDPGQRPAGDDREQDGREHADDAALGAVPHQDAGREGQRGRDRVADHVGDHRAGQRRDPRDRQHLEPVEDTLVHVLADLRPGRHAGGEHGLRDQARDQQRQVLLDAAGDRTAEDAREHGGEQQRLDGHVEELLEVAAHLQGGPPGHGHRLLDGVGQADALGQGVVSMVVIGSPRGSRRRLRGWCRGR